MFKVIRQIKDDDDDDKIIQLLIYLQSIFHLAAMQFCEVKSVYSSYGKFNVLISTGIISQSTCCTPFLKVNFQFVREKFSHPCMLPVK